MFEQATLSSGSPAKRLWTTCAGFSGQALLLGCLVVAPLVWPQVLPTATFMTSLVAPGPPPPPPPPPGQAVFRPRGTVPTKPLDIWWRTAPDRIPVRIDMPEDAPPQIAGSGVMGGVAGGQEGGVPDSVIGSILDAVPAAPPVRPSEVPRPAATQPTPAPIKRIRGGNVNPAEPVFRPDPVYPTLARQMRVSGVVELLGVIGIDGRMKELRVVSGHPLLARAALEAVQKWVYKPTRLNGEPVEVEAPITVTFHLNN